MKFMSIGNLLRSAALIAALVVTSVGAYADDDNAPCTSVAEIQSKAIYYQQARYGTPDIQLRGGDPVGPFPLATPMQFPWTTIDGIWSMKQHDGSTVYFSFEVQIACDGSRVIKVQSFDPKTFRVTASGLGIGSLNDTMVRAIMTSESTSGFMVYIRQYKQQLTRTKSKISTVVTIRPYDAEDTHLFATKESSLTLEKFVEKQRQAEQARRNAQARRRVASARP